MATRYIVSGATDWSSTASWSATSGGAGGSSVPATGDTVYIDRPCYINAGLDQSAVTLAALNVTPGMTSGSYIGTSSTSFKCGIKSSGGSTGVFKWSGLGVLYYHGDGAGADVCDEFWFSTGAGKAYLTGGTITNVYAGTSGLLTVNGAAISSYLVTSGCGVSITSGSVEFLDVMAGVTVVDNANADTVTVYNGGYVILRGNACACEEVFVSVGGKCSVQCADGITAASGQVTVQTGGRIDATGSPFPVSVTILYRYQGAYAFDNEEVPITIGTTVKRGYN